MCLIADYQRHWWCQINRKIADILTSIRTIQVLMEEAMGVGVGEGEGVVPTGPDQSLPGPSVAKGPLTIRDLTKSTVQVAVQHQRGVAGVS